MCGERVKNLQCETLTSNQELLSNIRHIKSRVHSNILDIAEKMVQEVRYVRPSLNIAEVLTKTTKTRVTLQQLVQTGQYDLPGGFSVKDSTMTSVGTRNKSTRMEQRRERSQGERRDKIDHFIPLNPVQSQTLQSPSEQPTRSSESGVTKQNQQSTKKLQVITAMRN